MFRRSVRLGPCTPWAAERRRNVGLWPPPPCRSGLLLALDQALTAMGVAAHHLAAVPSEMEDGGGGDSCRQQGGSAPEEEWARLGALGMADGGLG